MPNVDQAREVAEKLKAHIYRVSIVDATVFNLLDQLEAALQEAPKPSKVKDESGAGAE